MKNIKLSKKAMLMLNIISIYLLYILKNIVPLNFHQKIYVKNFVNFLLKFY
jgi:hypothetical protein